MILGFILLALIAPVVIGAVEPDSNLDSRVSALERRNSAITLGGGAAFLYGAFCALWAQNTGRGAWPWFFLGFFFSVITVIVLLYKDAQDRERASAVIRTG